MKNPSYLKMLADDLDAIAIEASRNLPETMPQKANRIMNHTRHARECLDLAAALIDDTRLKVSAGFENDTEDVQ